MSETMAGSDAETGEELRTFGQDLLDLFTFKRMGHLDRWGYSVPQFEGDPANGNIGWAGMVRDPAYYLPAADRVMIARAVRRPEVERVMRALPLIIEMGPGNQDSILSKTVPFLVHARRYMAIDASPIYASEAARIVREQTGIEASGRCDHYLRPTLSKVGREPTGFVMWGSSISNLEGRPDEDPVPRLVDTFCGLVERFNPGDTLFMSFDTERRGYRVEASYSTQPSAVHILSMLHWARRADLADAGLQPYDWHYRAIWYPATSLCVHTAIPHIAQEFLLGDQHIRVVAGTRYNLVNSYKFSREVIGNAARAAGFSRVLVTDDVPMALLVASV